MNNIVTGYYGRPKAKGQTAKVTRYVHCVMDGKPICRYKPHKTMQFQFCANGFMARYVDCPNCRAAWEKRK